MFDFKKAGYREIVKKVKQFQVENNSAIGAVFVSDENQLHSKDYYFLCGKLGYERQFLLA
jgi:hypothetical protein